MKALTYIEGGRFEIIEKAEPRVVEATDALVRVILSSICTSDLHIKHGSVPRAVPGVTVGHEMVGVVESVGEAVAKVKPGDRVAVNVETFCGECFFCQQTAHAQTPSVHHQCGNQAPSRHSGQCNYLPIHADKRNTHRRTSPHSPPHGRPA